MSLAVGALIQIRAMLTDFRVAFVLPVAVPVRGTVTENFICRTEIATPTVFANGMPQRSTKAMAMILPLSSAFYSTAAQALRSAILALSRRG